MYKIKWDRDSNGILLVNSGDNEIIKPPRPVFYEELDLLGFNRFWEYPKVQEPLLWAIGRNYYYKGELVAKVKGGNIFEPPEIELTENGQSLSLEPIDVKDLIEKNKEALFILENEALDFIEHTYKVYKKKGYLFTVSYSGGKDSQVVLDLVTRVISPDDLIVIFSDTTMEISYTYENIEKTKKEYERRYPGLKFYITKPSKSAIEFWREFGPPSRIHRWCSTVLKTAPFTNFIRNFLDNNKRKIIVFEGVRTEESDRRSTYQRIAKKVKHFPIINARPILYWNHLEVILYIYLRNLEMNLGYRSGLTRIGCYICPFSSEWSEYILSRIEYNKLNRYLELLREYSRAMGLREEEEIKRYIAKGQWKKRAGGRGLKNNNTVNFITDGEHLKGVLLNPRENFLEWIKVVGDILYNQKTPNRISGELKTGN
ncbi:MAG TPA: phosphoadenosine phosphosulfate reductase, partial [Methanothermococcus okinawensis]|nr:phosphoadenosine phosphosulfate reductase [Methanothermococcus okinawensis]